MQGFSYQREWHFLEILAVYSYRRSGFVPVFMVLHHHSLFFLSPVCFYLPACFSR